MNEVEGPETRAMRLEASSLRQRYSSRLVPDLRYSVTDRAHLLAIQERERVVLRLLTRYSSGSLAHKTILDVGCGSGTELLRFTLWGASPRQLHGIDLLPERVEQARQRNPLAEIRIGNAAQLPWKARSFDIVSQFTFFSSVLDDAVRRMAARELLRVLRPGGCVIWYDFRFNPRSGSTRGVQEREIYTLFPNTKVHLRRTTLAPPIARAIAPRSTSLAALLQTVAPPLRTHLVGLIVKT